MKVLEQFPHVKAWPGKEVGIEVEMEGQGCDVRNMRPVNLWKITEDGSLRGDACEFVLKGPCSRKDVPKVLRTLSEYIINNHIIPNDSDRCGVHIHVNVQDLTIDQCINFILLYLVFEDLMVRYCGEEREGNLFCLRAGDADMLLYQLRNCKMYGALNNLQSDQYRYASINISSLTKYGSLEFRSLKTPQDVLKIQPWTDMLLCIKDAAVAFDDSRDIVEGFSKNGEMAFLTKVFGKYADLLSFPNYRETMRDGVRRVQDIAYTKTVDHPMPKKIKPVEGAFNPIRPRAQGWGREAFVAINEAPHNAVNLDPLQDIHGHILDRIARERQEKQQQLADRLRAIREEQAAVDGDLDPGFDEDE